MSETWLPVVGMPRYEVSSCGRVRRAAWVGFRGKKYPARVLSTSGRASGKYPMVILYADGRRRGFTVHGLVAAAFVGSRPSGSEINHKDCDGTNNVVSNLEYVTPTENKRHAVQSGRYRGRRGVNVNGLSAARTELGITQADLARELGVAPETVRNWESGLHVRPLAYRALAHVFGAPLFVVESWFEKAAA